MLHNSRSSESVDKRTKSKLSVLHYKLKVQYRYRQPAATQVHPQEILIHLPTTKNQYLYWPHFIPSQIHAPNTLRVKIDVIWYVTTCIFADISTFRKKKPAASYSGHCVKWKMHVLRKRWYLCAKWHFPFENTTFQVVINRMLKLTNLTKWNTLHLIVKN